jgi:large subunit ribosomal protein L24
LFDFFEVDFGMKGKHLRSSKPIKVRGSLSLRPNHISGKSSAVASLSTNLKDKYTRNAVRLRVGDSVKLLRGEYSGIEGKIQKVFASDGMITVEGINREKIAGGTTPVRIQASNVVVTSLNLDDRWRREKIEGKS